MKITRLAPARESERVVRMAAAGAALAAVTALTVAGVAERTALAASFTVLGHLHWIWIPAALLLESASMAAFAIMLRRLLAAGGASVGVRPMLATAYAANAVSVSVPLAGPALATAFTFRRFTRQGADAPLAGWSLLAGGVISSAAAALVVVGGALASGNILVTAVAVPGGVLAVAVLVAAGRGRAPTAAARRARAASRMDATAGIPDAAPARRRARPDHPGLGAATGFTPASPVRLDDGDRPGRGQLARRRGGPGREHPRHRRHRPLARSSADLQRGHRRAKPQPHAGRARDHRGIAQPGAGRHRAGCQPGPGGGGNWSPDGCPPRSTPSRPTGRATAPVGFRRAGSRRTPAPSSTIWTRAASRARCSWGTPTAAGWRCRRRAWHPAGWRRWSCSRASARGA